MIFKRIFVLFYVRHGENALGLIYELLALVYLFIWEALGQ